MTEEHSPFIMEDYTTRTYGTGGLDNRPLFGETSARDRIINIIVGALTSLLVLEIFSLGRNWKLLSSVRPTKRRLSLNLRRKFHPGSFFEGPGHRRGSKNLRKVGSKEVTFISAFVFPQPPPKPVNVVFAFCILLCSVTGIILIVWYRQGDLEPKFRNLIYYILFSVVMLCICANLYFHDVGK